MRVSGAEEVDVEHALPVGEVGVSSFEPTEERVERGDADHAVDLTETFEREVDDAPGNPRVC